MSRQPTSGPECGQENHTTERVESADEQLKAHRLARERRGRFANEKALIDEIDSSHILPDDAVLEQRIGELEMLANARGWQRAKARITYMRAQLCIAKGTFKQALPHIRESRRAYMDAGDPLGAARTRVSELVVLIESGRYREAAKVGVAALDAVHECNQPGVSEQRVVAMLQQNLAICYEAQGQHEKAIESLRMVERIYREQGDFDSVAAARNNAAINWMHLDRFDHARHCLISARRLILHSENRQLRAQIYGNLGKLSARGCELDKALRWYQRSAQMLEGMDAQAERLILARKEADCFFALNLLREAQGRYREAIQGLELIGGVDQLGRARLGLAGCLAAMGRFSEAGSVLKAARKPLLNSGHSELAGRMALQVATLSRKQNDLITAEQESQHAFELLSHGEHPLLLQEALLLQADLAVRNPDRSRALLRRAKGISGSADVAFLEARRETIAARVAGAEGDDAGSEGHYRRAIRAWDRGWPGLLEDAYTRSFFGNRADAFHGLARLLLNDPGSRIEALGLLEEPRNRALRARMDRRAVRTAPMRGENSEWDQVCDTLDHLYSALVLPQSDDSESQQALLQAIRVQEERLASLRVSLSRRVRGRIQPAHVNLEHVLGQLPGDVDVIAYHFLDGRLMAFVWSDGRLVVQHDLASRENVEELVRTVSSVWSRYRGGRAFVSRFSDSLDRVARRALVKASEMLIQPLELTTASPRRTVFVPCGSLNLLPFAAMGLGGGADSGALLDRGPVGVVPSVELLARLAHNQAKKPARVLLVATDTPDLPGAQREAIRISEVLHKHGVECILLSGGDATRRNLEQNVESCDMLHFASHGVFRPESPESSAIQLADGWFNAVDLMHLNLDGRTVVFSACETGRSTIVGAEDSVGLARAALVAGASQVMLSQWLLDDSAASDLMIRFYSQLVGGASAYEALQSAQLETRDELTHAYYWAPYVLLGYPFGKAVS